ncbi:MAG: hypothetical protein H0W05_05925 [Thermoleophilaceae bacterium]|nr:hypothetical protein [Thermoleophilaceae bacterium]
MAGPSAKELAEQAVRRIQAEVPALEPLKLVVGLELRGRGDVQLYRVELPGPKVTKDPAADARVRVAVARSHFNELAADGRVRHWREAIESGHVKVTGPEPILELVANVVARHDERARTPKTRR